ncbi:hypothetical protein [Actinomadura alba]|uniref:Uncharacterized protein n=1 Tax=Actinomadura alba TaxID=406431 RepID=A0ABR7M1E7_9ACTN|nr:hypothetical protein [Actinomadura alba]MBC6470944.1 hypothetical protein [Actinomadura alba]
MSELQVGEIVDITTKGARIAGTTDHMLHFTYAKPESAAHNWLDDDPATGSVYPAAYAVTASGVISVRYQVLTKA